MEDARENEVPECVTKSKRYMVMRKTWETVGGTSICVKLAGCAECVNKIKMALTKTRITGIHRKSLVSAVFTRCVHRIAWMLVSPTQEHCMVIGESSKTIGKQRLRDVSSRLKFLPPVKIQQILLEKQAYCRACQNIKNVILSTSVPQT